MSKVARIKEERKAGPIGVKVKLEIIMMDDGKVTVSGPINDPVFVTSLMSQGMNALAAYWAQQREEASRIVKPASGLILPKG